MMQASRLVLLLLLPIIMGINIDAQEIKLGAISVLSGEGSAWGLNHQRGTLLAVEEINIAGGIGGRKVRVHFEDSMSGLARNALSAFHRILTEHSVRIILGPLMQDEYLTVAPLAQRKNIFLMIPTYIPSRLGAVFSTWVDSASECHLLAARVFKTHKSLAIVGSSQSWEHLMADEFQRAYLELGGRITYRSDPLFDADDLKSDILKLHQTRPDAIFISSYFLLNKAIRILRELKTKAALFSIELDQSIIEAAKDQLDGLIYIGPSPPSKEFQAQFRQRWGFAPDIPAVSSYKAMKLLGQAIASVGDEPQAINTYLQNNYPTYAETQPTSFFRISNGITIEEQTN